MFSDFFRETERSVSRGKQSGVGVREWSQERKGLLEKSDSQRNLIKTPVRGWTHPRVGERRGAGVARQYTGVWTNDAGKLGIRSVRHWVHKERMDGKDSSTAPLDEARDLARRCLRNNREIESRGSSLAAFSAKILECVRALQTARRAFEVIDLRAESISELLSPRFYYYPDRGVRSGLSE